MISLTVASQVKQTIASLKGTRSTLETFATFEDNESNKTQLQESSQELGEVIDRLENRIKVLEFEEPQYKGF